MPHAAGTFGSATPATNDAPSWQARLEPTPRRLSPASLVTHNPIVQSSVVVRASYLRTAGGYRWGKRYAEDYDLWLRLANVAPIYFIGNGLVRRHRTENQLSQARARMVEGKWEALAHFLRHETPNPDYFEGLDAAQLVDMTLDSDMAHARSDWNRALLQSIIESAKKLQPSSARVAYWSRWLTYAWPSLRAARFLGREFPSLLHGWVRRRLS